MNRHADAIPASEHEAIYKAYWHGGFRSITEAARQTGHAIDTIKRLIALVPVALLEMPERMTPADRVRWCKVHGCCFVCGIATNRKSAYTCRECCKEWKYCPTCEDVIPMSLFYSANEGYCKQHRNERMYPHATYRRRTRDEQAAELAQIEAMRKRGWTWQQIADHHKCRVKTIQQRCSDWRKALGISNDAT